MKSLFCPIVDGKAVLSEEDERHLFLVLRAKEGEPIEVVDGDRRYKAVVSSLNPPTIVIEKETETGHELDISLILGFSLLKGQHDEWALEKGTELGVSAFHPFVSSRTIVQLADSQKEKRLLRHEKIVKGAAEQSSRDLIPEVRTVKRFEELLEEEADVKVLAYENEEGDVSSYLEKVANMKKGERLLVLIGPEGGFSLSEVQKAKAKGFSSVSLGRRILRAETAMIAAAALAMGARRG